MQIVYSVYHHQYFQYLISPSIVELLPEQVLSFTYHNLFPENQNAYKDWMDETDLAILKLCYEIHPNALIKRFGGDVKNKVAFFENKWKGEVINLCNAFVQKRLAQIFPLLQKKVIFEMGNDGYPAYKKIQMLEEKASILFHFKRESDKTTYYPTLRLRGQLTHFQFKKANILCLNPAWMLLNGELFTFKDEIDGKKLQPFLAKSNIEIPRAKELEYYDKFVRPLLEKYEVKATGFEVQTIQKQADFSLHIRSNEVAISLTAQVHYENFSLSLFDAGTKKAIFRPQGEEYTFFKILRDAAKEEEIRTLLKSIEPNPDSLMPWDNIPRDKGLDWLQTNIPALEAAGIRILQEEGSPAFLFERPQVEMQLSDHKDWFDVEAIVKIGKFAIPFLQFRNHILRGKREYVLPDDSIAVLPDTWFQDYRHLMEVSEWKGNVLKVRASHAALLQLSTGQSLNQNPLLTLEEIPENPLPKGLRAELRTYQKKGFDWLCYLRDRGMGGILADDMGLGKTLQTLSLLLNEKEVGIKSPSLVVLPTSLVYNWLAEAKKFAPELNILVHTGTNRARGSGSFLFYDIVLSTYGLVRQDVAMLKDCDFHYIILDESQAIKNPDSKTTQAVRQLKGKHRLTITGTPVENTVLDLWSQMEFLNPNLLGGETFFRNMYANPIEKEKSPKHSARLRKLVYPYILRRKKEQVAQDLPPKIENIHYCEMEEAQQKRYDEVRDQYRNYLADMVRDGSFKKNKLNVLAGLQKLRQIAVHPRMLDESVEIEGSGKYKEVKRLLQEIIAGGSKVLIFSQYVRMLQIVKEDLERENIPFLYLDGGTQNRMALVNEFQNKHSNIPVFLISLKAGGVGLNLTAADYVFILDPWWNPAAEQQAIDRAHRIGQDKTVFYYKFISQESLEEKILKLQAHKAQLSDDLISTEEDFFARLSEEEVLDLLEN